jgi:hypothetical protein
LPFEVGAGKAFARTLYGEAELVEQSRDVLRVVVHAEALRDPLAD